MDIDLESGHNIGLTCVYHFLPCFPGRIYSMDDVKSKFFAKIAEFFSVDRSTLSDATTAANVDGWDSIRHTELILDLEDLFDIELPLVDVQAAENLGELSQVVADTVAKAGAR